MCVPRTDSQHGSYVEYMANLDRLTIYVDNVKYGTGVQQQQQQKQQQVRQIFARDTEPFRYWQVVNIDRKALIA